MTQATAVDRLRARAETMRQRGLAGLADLLDRNADQGEEHAAQYLDMMSTVGKAARRIRERDGWP